MGVKGAGIVSSLFVALTFSRKQLMSKALLFLDSIEIECHLGSPSNLTPKREDEIYAIA